MLGFCLCPGGVHSHGLDILVSKWIGQLVAIFAWTLEPEGPNSSPASNTSYWAHVNEPSFLTLHWSARLGATVGQGWV